MTQLYPFLIVPCGVSSPAVLLVLSSIPGITTSITELTLFRVVRTHVLIVEDAIDATRVPREGVSWEDTTALVTRIAEIADIAIPDQVAEQGPLEVLTLATPLEEVGRGAQLSEAEEILVDTFECPLGTIRGMADDHEVKISRKR